MSFSSAARRTGVLLVPALILAITGCTGTATASAPAATSGPSTIDNCGFAVPATNPPERVLTIKSTTTEMLLALGLGDVIIGQAFPDGPVPDEWAAQAADIPLVSTNVPGREAVLELEPDLVFAGWESNVTDQGVGDRAGLAALGIRTYVAPSACKEPGYKPEKLTFDDVFAEIEQAGVLFGADDAAGRLVTDQRAQLDAIAPLKGSPTALWYSSGTETPYVGAGIGAPQMMMEAAGLTNIAAGLDDTWASYNWEAVIDANPDVIVLVDATWNTAASKKDKLAANPATAQMDAVINQRYIVVPFAGGEAGVRNVEVTADIVRQAQALGLGSAE